MTSSQGEPIQGLTPKTHPLDPDSPKYDTVAAVGELDLSDGLIVPPLWVRRIRYNKGRPHILASLALSYIAKVYKGELIQIDYKVMASYFNTSKKQVTLACDRLQNMGLITRVLKKAEAAEGRTANNVLFIRLNIDRLKRLNDEQLPFLPYVHNYNNHVATPGYIYLAMASIRSYPYKIGASTGPQKRIDGFFTVKMPFGVYLIHQIPCDDMLRGEKALHVKFKKVRGDGEWFNLWNDELNYIKSITGYFNSQFTFKGEASER